MKLIHFSCLPSASSAVLDSRGGRVCSHGEHIRLGPSAPLSSLARFSRRCFPIIHYMCRYIGCADAPSTRCTVSSNATGTQIYYLYYHVTRVLYTTSTPARARLSNFAASSWPCRGWGGRGTYFVVLHVYIHATVLNTPTLKSRHPVCCCCSSETRRTQNLGKALQGRVPLVHASLSRLLASNYWAY